MKRILTTGLATLALTVPLAVPLAMATAAPAAAAKPASPGAGGACVQAGLDTLRTLDLFGAATKKQIDYSTLANPTTGPIFTTLPEGSFLSLGQVVRLHATHPQLFAWCAPSPS